MEKKIFLHKEYIQIFCWGIALFGYFFQVYEPSFSRFIVPCLGSFLFLEVKNIKWHTVKGWILLFSIYSLFLLICFIHGLFENAGLSKIIRFLVVLMVIPIAGLIDDNRFKKKWDVFKILSMAEAVLIIIFWFYIFIKQDYSEARLWAKTAGVGDIYIINGIPRIQVRGTCLLVVGFIVDFLKRGRFTFYNLMVFVAGIMAGNSAYVLGYALTVIFYYGNLLWHKLLKRSWKAGVLIFIGILFLIIFGRYAISIWNLKAQWSNAVRLEQAKNLMDTNFIWGNGLGCDIVANNILTSYAGNTYFELQTLYIFNQIGFLGILMFYMLSISPYFNKNTWQLRAYIIYLVVAFWNPYCFDSTHIFAVFMITNYLKSVQPSVKPSENINKGKQKRRHGWKVRENYINRNSVFSRL